MGIGHPGGLPGVRGGERPRLASLNLVSGSAQDANLLTSDYQKPLPDNADHARTSLVSSADASGRCGLVLDVGDRFR